MVKKKNLFRRSKKLKKDSNQRKGETKLTTKRFIQLQKEAKVPQRHSDDKRG